MKAGPRRGTAAETNGDPGLGSWHGVGRESSKDLKVKMGLREAIPVGTAKVSCKKGVLNGEGGGECREGLARPSWSRSKAVGGHRAGGWRESISGILRVRGSAGRAGRAGDTEGRLALQWGSQVENWKERVLEY